MALKRWLGCMDNRNSHRLLKSTGGNQSQIQGNMYDGMMLSGKAALFYIDMNTATFQIPISNTWGRSIFQAT